MVIIMKPNFTQTQLETAIRAMEEAGVAENLDAYRAALRNGEVEQLLQKLAWSAGRKHQMNLGERSSDPYYV